MKCQVLASGSKGNATLIRAGETCVLVDAGLKPRDLRDRLGEAAIPFRGLDHVLVTHGHLDHARSAGSIAKSHGATLHCATAIQTHRSVNRARRMATLRAQQWTELEGLRFLPVPVPHDCDPTVGYAIESEGRRVSILTDIGRPDDGVARELAGAHVLILEFNYDPEMLEAGPYKLALQNRIRGGQGHLSNAQAGEMLTRMIGPNLHTLVLAHLSQKNNLADLALEEAHRVLAQAGRSDVKVLVASQDEVGPQIPV